MTNTTKYVLIAIVFVLVAIIIYLNRPEEKAKELLEEECFKLPTSSDPIVFGPSYWKAFHKLSHDVPCEGCRTFAEKFMIFFHDLVNLKTNKKLWDEKNFNEMSDLIFQVKAGGNTWPQ